MATKSFVKNYVIPLTGTIIIVAEFILKLMGYLPPLFAVISLAIIGIASIVFLWKRIQSIGFRALSIILCTVVFAGLAFYFSKPKGMKMLASASQQLQSNNSTSNNLDNSHSFNDNSTVKNTQINGSNNTQTNVNAPNAQIVQTGQGSKAAVNNYNLPSQRYLNEPDVTRLKKIPLNQKVRVIYPANNNEAFKYADEIWNKLFDLGYKPIAKQTYNNLAKSSTKRFEITSDEEPEHFINITINPQF